MKNKKATYMLLSLVVCIWGIIGIRIYKHIHDSDNDEYNAISAINNSTYIPDSSKNVELKLNYKDPFLKRNVVVARSTSTPQINKNRTSANIRNRVSRPNQPVHKKMKSWPDIQYSGLILNDKTNEELGLVQIGSQSFLIRNGDIREKIEILAIFADSVIVRYEDDQKTFLKN
jgi:hypothetical protein